MIEWLLKALGHGQRGDARTPPAATRGNVPEGCEEPLRKLERRLRKRRYRRIWPQRLTDRAARTACERRDINGLRDIAETLEAREADPDGLPDDQERAGKLGALLRWIEKETAHEMIEESRALG